MKIETAIKMANLMEPGNTVPEELAILLLTELDGMIQTDIMLLAPEEIVTYESAEQELLLRPPHDALYVHYLVMMIRQCQQEFEAYNNSQVSVEEKLANFREWYVDHYDPVRNLDRSYIGGGAAGGFGFAYLSAYGSAVKLGFTGTEEEWLESLRGETGAASVMRYDAQSRMLQWKSDGEWVDLMSLDELVGEALAAAVDQAQQAAEKAELYVNAAGSYAEAADVAAVAAEGSAGNAASSAETAQRAADEAGNHTSNAGNYAKEAASSAASAAEVLAALEAARESGEFDGADGVTPHIGSNGYWYIGTTNTGVRAQGVDGRTPYIGADGCWWIGVEETGVQAVGQDGRGIESIQMVLGDHVPGSEDYYLITYTDGTTSQFEVYNGADGDDGVTPHIGENGNWYVGDTDTGVKAQGEDGVVAVTGASVGQLIVVKAVDENGVPTEWEPVDRTHYVETVYEDSYKWTEVAIPLLESPDIYTAVYAQRETVVFYIPTFDDEKFVYVEDTTVSGAEAAWAVSNGTQTLYVAAYDGGEALYVQTSAGAKLSGSVGYQATVTVSREEVHELDEKFIPSSIARTADIPEITNLYVCSDGEYTAGGAPTVGEPDAVAVYLVPQDDEGSQYAGWVYTDGAWEFVEMLTVIYEEAEGGSDGSTPVKGVDYYTEADKEEMVADVIAALPVYDGEVEEA